MPGKGPAPKVHRRNPSDVPIRGEWRPAPGVGWQHGAIPEPPSGLSDEARTVWASWMESWVAAHWRVHDLGGLYQTIRLYDMLVLYHDDPVVWKQNEDGTWSGTRRPDTSANMRQLMDVYGITPKGQQDRRWQVPDDVEKPAAKTAPSPYTRLRVAG